MAEGSCQVDFGDYSDDADPVEFFDTKIVRARKPHVCDECRGPIVVGEAYQRTAYRFEGKFDMDRQCACCREAAAEFHFHVFGGLLWRMFIEEWEQGAHLQACVNRLSTAKAKEHMRRQWLKWKKLPIDEPPEVSHATE
jgi:hypothetical protein